MTGYLWLCEKCNGNGSLIEQLDARVRMVTRMAWPYDAPFAIFEYRGTQPEIVRCKDCHGRGYWEP